MSIKRHATGIVPSCEPGWTGGGGGDVSCGPPGREATGGGSGGSDDEGGEEPLTAAPRRPVAEEEEMRQHLEQERLCREGGGAPYRESDKYTHVNTSRRTTTSGMSRNSNEETASVLRRNNDHSISVGVGRNGAQLLNVRTTPATTVEEPTTREAPLGQTSTRACLMTT